MWNRLSKFFFRFIKNKNVSRIDGIEVKVLDCGREMTLNGKTFSLKREMEKWNNQLPLVSCLMVTKNRAPLAKCAIMSFLNQSYPHKELVIVDDGEQEELATFIHQLSDGRIRHIRLEKRHNILGCLRNMSVKAARGDLVCQWDDDDLSDPLRLEMQVGGLLIFEVEASLLCQELLWWPRQNRLAISRVRIWEGSFMARKAALVPYPEIPRGEDTLVITHLIQTTKVVVLNNPYLYLYVVHGKNTFESHHFDCHWVKAQETFEKKRYDSLLEKLSLRMPIEAYLKGVHSL